MESERLLIDTLRNCCSSIYKETARRGDLRAKTNKDGQNYINNDKNMIMALSERKKDAFGYRNEDQGTEKDDHHHPSEKIKPTVVLKK